MREIGGYIELDKYTGEMLYENAIKLNSARNALAYIIKTNNIKKLYMPKFLCDSAKKVLISNNVDVHYYSIDINFKPILNEEYDWIYIVNFYGQLSNEYLSSFKNNVIIDNVQAYFQKPISNFNTIYSCRKFFGVPDGAILFTDKKMEINQIDISFDRMNFLLGRYECDASRFYSEYINNNSNFENQPIKLMSKLTNNLLHAIDYDQIKKIRKRNFEILHNSFDTINKLKLIVPEGAFMYPLYVENGSIIKEKLIERKIYVPTLWPDVFNKCTKNELEYDMAKNIIPLPIDQRYDKNDMDYIINEVFKIINELK